MVELSPQLQQQIARFEQMRQQVQMITTQRLQLESQHREIERALEELEKAGDDVPIYKNAGMLLIKAKSKADVISELKEAKEILGIRVKTIEKQERNLKEQFEELQKKLATALRGLQATAGTTPGPSGMV
jgi:prefoldin beta subunit